MAVTYIYQNLQDGDDLNDGLTTLTPKKTLQAIATLAGTTPATALCTLGSSGVADVMTTRINCTSGYGNDGDRPKLIACNSDYEVDGTMYEIDASSSNGAFNLGTYYWYIEGFWIKDCGGGNAAIAIAQHYNTINNCKITNAAYQGIYNTNKACNIWNTTIDGAGAAISRDTIYGCGAGSQIINCLLANGSATGIWGSTGCTIVNNLIYGMTNDGMYMSADRNTIMYNLFHDNAKSGIQVGGNDRGYSHIFYNKFINNAQWGINISLASSDIYGDYNGFYGNPSGSYRTDVSGDYHGGTHDVDMVNDGCLDSTSYVFNPAPGSELRNIPVKVGCCE